MSEVNITTNKPLSADVLEKIDRQFGFEVILDNDDFCEDLRPSYPNYFFGHLAEHDTEEDEDLLSYEDAQNACAWIEKTFPDIPMKLSVRP